MTTASRAKLVLGFPCAGPTCSAVKATPSSSWWELRRVEMAAITFYRGGISVYAAFGMSS